MTDKDEHNLMAKKPGYQGSINADRMLENTELDSLMQGIPTNNG